MNKKLKLAAALTALTMVGGAATVALTGCGEDAHTHTYTQWDYSDAEHWKKCPVDGVIDESTRKGHTFTDGACECGAPAKQVTVTDGTAADANGTISIDKTSVLSGAQVTVTVNPAAGYQLKDMTVNGEGVSSAMTGNTYTFVVTENTTVIAVFEKIASSSIDAKITGKKYGVTGNSIAVGTAVTLSAVGRTDITTAVVDADGQAAIRVAEIAGDDWTVKIDGYVETEIIIPRDVTYDEDIALEYDLFENLKTAWGAADQEDLSEQNDGVIAHKSGYFQWLSTKETYESVAITAKAVKGGFRQGVLIRFKGDSYANDGFVMLQKENQQKVCWCGAGPGDPGNPEYIGKNIFADQWDGYIEPLGKNEYDLTLVRDGDKIYVFIDGDYKATKTLPAEYADKECSVGLFCTNAMEMNGARTFAIRDASDFLEIAVTDGTATDAHGSIVIDKPTAALNEKVTVTVTPADGYKLKDLTVGGVSVIAGVKAGVYTFTALKDVTVVAEFEEYVTVNSVAVTVTAATGFTADGATIMFDQLGETWTGTVASGQVTIGSTEKPVAVGAHNVYASFGGYMIKLGTVEVEQSETDATVGKPVEVTLGFTESATGRIEYAGSVISADPVTGELTFKLGKDDHGAYNNKYDIVDIVDGGYFATKVKFNDIGSNRRSLSLILLVQKPDGTTKEIKYVIQNADRFFGENDKFYMNLDDDSIGGMNGAFDKNNSVNINAYASELKGDGLWLVLKYDASNGDLVTYAGAALDCMRPIRTWGSLPAGLKVTDIGLGNWFGDKNQDYGGNNDTATVIFKYGKTMQDIGMALEQKVTVTATVSDAAMGTVVLDDADGKYYVADRCTVTVTANTGYALKSIKVGEGAAVTEGWTQNGNVYTYSFTVPEGGSAVAVEMQEQVLVDTAVITISGGPSFDANGATLTFKLLGNTYTGVVTDGAVTIGSEQDRVIIGEYAVSTTVNGITINLGSVLLTKTGDTGAGTIALDGSTIFANTECAAAGYVLKDLAVTLDLVNAANGNNGYHNKLVLEVPKTDTAYLLYKISLPADIKTKLVENSDKKINFSMPVVVNGSETIVKFVIQNGTVKYQFYAGSIANFWGTEVTLPAAYWTALTDETTGNGIYLAVCVDKTQKKLYSYVGTDLNNMRPAPDIGNFDREVETVGVSMGNGVGTTDLVDGACVTVAVKYGTSMEDVGIALEQKADVTASVNDDAMGSVALDAADGKYYVGNECTVTVTATQGYILKSVKVGENEAVTEGWTRNGNTYTYKFTVSAGGAAVTVTLEKAASANVTFTFTGATLAANTAVELTSKWDGSKKQYLTGSGAIELALGEYDVFVYGYAKTAVNVTEEGEVEIALTSVIAYTTDSAVAIDNANGTITITGSGASDRQQKRTNNAEYVLTAEQKTAQDFTLTFNLKRDADAPITTEGGDAWAAKRAGVQIGKGNIGFFFFFRTTEGGGNTATDVSKLGTGSDKPLDLNPGQGEQKWHDNDASLAWVVNAAHGENGLTIKVVRTGGSIKIYAQKPDGTWEQLNSSNDPTLEIGNDVENEIKFVSGGDTYIFSAITVETTAWTIPTETAVS